MGFARIKEDQPVERRRAVEEDRQMVEKAVDWTRKKEYRQLKKEMLADLAERGLVSRPYSDKVAEYMDLWVLKQELMLDIKKRGVCISYQNGANQMGTTENKSMSALVRVSHQMLAIWSALGFKDKANAKGQVFGGEIDEL